MMYPRKLKSSLKGNCGGILRLCLIYSFCISFRQDFIVSKIIEDEEDETEDVFKSTQRAQDFRLTFYDEDFDIPLPPDTTEPNLTIYELMEMKNIEVYPYVEPEKDQETKEE